MLELYHHHTSVCAAKARMGLEEKGLAWTGHMIHLRESDQHTPEYHALNPFGQVPVLIHDGRVIVDSNIINEYVDEAFDGPPLRPADPAARARMRFWTRQLDEDIHAAIGVLTTAVAYRHVPKHAEQVSNQVDPYKRDRKRHSIAGGIETPHFRIAIRRMDMFLGHVEEALGGDGPGRVCAGGGPDWLCGEYSLADLAYAPYMMRLDCLRLAPMWDRRPRVAAWYERLSARPAFRRAIVDWFDEDPSWVALMREKGAEARDRMLAILAAA